MRLTRTPSGERLRERTARRPGAARPGARQPHAGAVPHAPAVEDGHVAAQEDVAEDPEGPERRGHVQALEAEQAEAGATASNLQGDQPGRRASRPPSPLLPRKPKLRPGLSPPPSPLPPDPRAQPRFLRPLLAPVRARAHSQLHLLSPPPAPLRVTLTSLYLDDVVLGGEVEPDAPEVEGHGRELRDDRALDDVLRGKGDKRG